MKHERRSWQHHGNAAEARGVAWLVEDSALDAEMVRRALGAVYDVEVFTDGNSMLERLTTTEGPDILVLDWQLPGMSGIELCRFIRATWDDTALPILMLTVSSLKADIVEGLSAGANDYLTKPYDASELLARVTALARSRRLFLQREHLLEQTREARERAEDANRAKDEFLAIVSHELRTPLNAITGWVKLLLEGVLPEEKIGHALETIARNAKAQKQLIDDLLDVARIISGKLQLKVEPIELVSVLDSVLEAVRPASDAKSLRLHAEIDPQVGSILGDATRLQQVIWNLLNNAVKFTPKGGKVNVCLLREGSTVELAVEDTGQGIPASFLPYVFERFQQADTGMTRRHGGLGIGLALARHITELHGGTIEVASDGEGRGSTFTVRLPVAPPAGSAGGRADRAEEAPAPVAALHREELDGLRILVVDDEPDAREMLALVLEKSNARVSTASSAAEALEVLQRTLPDVLVSDVGMPYEDGTVLIRRVRALPRDKGGGTPAVALTAYARAEDRTKTLLAGFDVHVVKPVDPTELMAVIADLMNRRIEP